MNMLNRNCKTSYVKPEFLKKAQRANPRLYDIGCYNDNLALILAPEFDEMIRLAQEKEMVADLRYFNSLEHEVDSLKSQLETQKTQFLNEIDRLSMEYYYADHMNAILGVYTTLDEFTYLQCDYVDQVVKCECLEKELSKSNTTSKSFEALQKHAINLEIALQQYLKAQLQDKGIAISELKKLIEKMKGKYVETKFEKSSVIRQPNAFKSQRQSVLVEYGVSISIGYGVSSSLSNTAYSSQLINTAYPLPLDMAYRSSGTEAEIFECFGRQLNTVYPLLSDTGYPVLCPIQRIHPNRLIRQYSEEEKAEAMTETMEQYMSKTRTDYGSGVARHNIDNKDQFELKGQFIKELQEHTFSGSDNEDANYNTLCFQVIDDDDKSTIHLLYYSVMSDSDESVVTYTEVSSPFKDLSDIGSPRADDYEYLELSGMPEDPYVEAALQAPPSPGYVPGLEEPKQAPPSLDYVPGPKHADDEISDPEADPEEDDDEDPEEDPVDYPADGGDDGDDEEGSSKDDEDDDMDIEADDEEEHPALADYVVVALPTTDQAPFAEETEPFETDESAATPPPHPAYRVTARISIPAPVPTPVWSDAEVARLLAISTPPSSPLSPWSSPLPQIPSPSLPLSPPSPVLSPAPPPSPICSLGYRATMIWMRAEATSTSHSLLLPPPFILSPTKPDAPSLGIPLPLPISVLTSSPPLLLPSASRREDRPEVTLPPRKRLGIALGSRYEVGESSSAAAAKPARGLRADYGFVATMDREIRRDPEREVGYGITDSWDEIVETLQGEPVSTDTELAHAYTRHQMETEARLSREAWRRSMDASDLARKEVMSLRTTVLGQMLEIRELHAADHRR
ncbi:hypothetical protein Tco_0951895 [Tanacetum coccineum]|uniref:Uncharacterized protein n=1 Tax=Tanacetum coccineum TaxID=301880 RepID=A0ABQ5DVS9_9ASTR